MPVVKLGTANDHDGKPEFRNVYKGVTLDPIAVGTARKEEPQFAEGMVAWEMKTTICCNATHGTNTVRNAMARPQQRRTHQNHTTAADLCSSRYVQNFNKSPRRRGLNHGCKTTFGRGQAFL